VIAKVLIAGLTDEALHNAGFATSNLRPYHVIVGEHDEQRVHDALTIMPYQLRPRVKRSSQISVATCSRES
jgi:DNA-directed RNA polymerase subunit H (RpoH/RPB5)